MDARELELLRFQDWFRWPVYIDPEDFGDEGFGRVGALMLLYPEVVVHNPAELRIANARKSRCGAAVRLSQRQGGPISRRSRDSCRHETRGTRRNLPSLS